MNNFYLYKFNYSENTKGSALVVSASVIFCDKQDINEDNLKEEIRKFYQANYQTDKIFIIGGEYLKEKLNDVFIVKQNDTFIGIPKKQETHLSESIYVITFDKIGKLFCDKDIPVGFLNSFLNEGLQNIFIKRGGLITSEGSHHFVFPSGKHCDKFIRTGNILLVSSEIYFIAFALLKHFDEEKHDQIYCDTSSINSVAFALVELKNRFLICNDRKQISIESFSSYEGLYKNELSYTENAFLIISASTSSNIITYILNGHKMIGRENITILFFLGEEKKYLSVKDKVICNLTQSKSNINGIPFYDTYTQELCDHCKNGSYPVEVSGDVFLLEKPKINPIVLSVKDAENYLSDLLLQFKSDKQKNNIFRVNYKENSKFKYEVYIDYQEILKGVNEGRYVKYSQKLKDYINQFIPSNTKYIISLNDKASSDLSQYINDKIQKNYNQESLPVIINQDQLSLISKDVEGTAVVVGSCIANGKNLLFVSRALRNRDKLRIVYFIGISRTKNKEYLSFLKSNLKQGRYGAESSSFIEVESILCNNDVKNTSWVKEIEFIKKFSEFIKDEIRKYDSVVKYLDERKQMLYNSSGENDRGLVNKLFYPRLLVDGFEELQIRKNFAFFKFDDYADDVTQADIYFTISNIINNLRNSDKNLHTLKQTVFVRNILDPANFSRFNDGIIQASILRAANPEELSYGLDFDLSQEMTNTLETLIKYYNDDQGEALVEFLYAIAINKLTLKKNHLRKIIELINECDFDILKCFSLYIESVFFPKQTPAE